jgi:hypothetical protein
VIGFRKDLLHYWCIEVTNARALCSIRFLMIDDDSGLRLVRYPIVLRVQLPIGTPPEVAHRVIVPYVDDLYHPLLKSMI